MDNKNRFAAVAVILSLVAVAIALGGYFVQKSAPDVELGAVEQFGQFVRGINIGLQNTQFVDADRKVSAASISSGNVSTTYLTVGNTQTSTIGARWRFTTSSTGPVFTSPSSSCFSLYLNGVGNIVTSTVSCN